MSNIHVGTCSWAEKSLIESGEFYPKGVSSAEDRLKYYASRFDTVEIDATYYAIPAAHTTGLWAERTPANFLFHVKVYGALTGHGTDPRTLPKTLRELLPAAEKDKRTIYIKEPELLKAVADAFVALPRPSPGCRQAGTPRLPVPAVVLVQSGGPGLCPQRAGN